VRRECRLCNTLLGQRGRPPADYLPRCSKATMAPNSVKIRQKRILDADGFSDPVRPDRPLVDAVRYPPQASTALSHSR
jgi:hypothetical protein